MNFFLGYMEYVFFLLPTVVVKVGRDLQTHKPATILIAIQWLCFEAGMEIEIYTRP